MNKALVGRLFLIGCWAFVCEPALGATIRVPADQPTIQSAINAAVTGDTILVASGTYTENINYRGKPITIVSENGPAATIIDGNHAGTVVTFNTQEGRDSVLDGFTIQNGNALTGGGVYIRFSSPTIKRNIIANNVGSRGGGILMEFNGSPLIQSNVITRNQAGCCGAEGGGGILVFGGGNSTQILNNLITQNSCKAGNGGGIELNISGTMT